MNSCLIVVVTLAGQEVQTIERVVGCDGTLPRLYQAFVDYDGLQRGFCTLGQIMSTLGLLNEGETGANPERIREAMSGNLCRYGAHH